MDTRLESISRLTTGHSAEVKLFLHINGHAIPLSHAADSAVKATGSMGVPAGIGEVETIVDGKSFFRKAHVAKQALPGEWAQLA